MSTRNLSLWGLFFITIAIVLGAFGAHALKEILSDEKLNSFETGVRYQMYHGLGLLLIAALKDKWAILVKIESRLLVIGTMLFSFSIYGLAMQDVWGLSLGFLGPITPIGGSLLIVGWLILAVKIWKKETNEKG